MHPDDFAPGYGWGFFVGFCGLFLKFFRFGSGVGGGGAIAIAGIDSLGKLEHSWPIVGTSPEAMATDPSNFPAASIV
jgi:hypothetical protein